VISRKRCAHCEAAPGSCEARWFLSGRRCCDRCAGDPRLPYWLRVAALAYGCHTNNGHARFKRGEVALVLAAVDEVTGEVRPFTNVRREIARAVEFGWLEDGSYWGCLIVPAHSIKKGEYGSVSPCPLNPKHKERRANRSPSERNGSPSSTPGERFEDETDHPVSGSERKPLSLICTSATTNPAAPERSAS
jgi:hypothetical protein